MSSRPLGREEHRVVWDHLVLLRDLWSQYEYLFMHGADRVALLNSAAKWFFYSVQKSYESELIIGISRLTDPPGEGNRSNLTIAVILDDPRVKDATELCKELESAIKEAKDAAETLRVHRNKRLAHLDRDVAAERAEPLPPLKLSTLGAALGHLERAYHRYGLEIEGTDFVFDLSPLGSVDRLMEVLDAGVKARIAERERRRLAFVDGRSADSAT